MFILATTELNKVPATILSRCQRHSFRRLDTESIVGRLNYVAAQEQIDLTPEAARLLAVRSEGGMRDALSMLDQCAGRERIDAETVYSALGLAGNREIAALLRQLAAHDSVGAITAFNRLWQEGKDPSTLLGELSSLMRDLLLDAIAPKDGRALRSGSFDDEILDGFRGMLSPERLIEQITVIQNTLAELRSGQAKMRSELCLIALCEPTLSDSIPVLRERVAALEQAVHAGIPAPRSAPPETAELPPIPIPGPAAERVPAPPAEEPADLPKRVPAESQETEFEPAPAPEPESEPAPADAGDLWKRVCARLGERFPIGIAMIIGDDLQVRACPKGDRLILAICNDFAKNIVDRPDILASLSELASETAGHPVRVQTTEPDAPELQRSAAEINDRLESLRQFDIVTFKDHKTED